MLASLEVRWGGIWKRRRLRGEDGFLSFQKGAKLQARVVVVGSKSESKYKQPPKEAKKNEAKRSKRNTVTKLSGFVTISLLLANEQRGGRSRGDVLYNTLLRQDSY